MDYQNENNSNVASKLNLQKAISQLSSFIRIPSVSAGTKHKRDVINCANWLAKNLLQTGLENVQIIKTANHPVVYADWMHVPGKPCLLIYGHYDVQPADPLNEWEDEPFSGNVKNGFIYGRGASDDKGQLFAHVKALEYFLQINGKLPINIKCVFEGEEEIGSPGLQQLIKNNPALLKADAAAVSDMSIPSATQPAITLSLRSMLSLELELTAQKADLHSGTFGGAVDNPVQALCKMIAALQDENGRVNIPGFYKNVLPLHDDERRYMKQAGRSDDEILRDARAVCSNGEAGYSLYEKIAARPSLSVNGITAGYQGDGPKAIIPSSAKAKISMRLVASQSPGEIGHLFSTFISSITPACMKSSVRINAAAKPVIIYPENIFIKAAAKAYENVFRNNILFLGSGGTIPIVNLLQEKLFMPVILMGFALPDDAPHGPNEKFSLTNFQKGIETSILFMEELGRFKRRQSH